MTSAAVDDGLEIPEFLDRRKKVNVAKVKTALHLKLREWQVRCMLELRTAFDRQQDFVIVAVPGGGKTKMALAFARRLIEEGLIDHVHIIVPSKLLRRHWHHEAVAFGLTLIHRPNGTLQKQDELRHTIHGFIATFDQVNANPDAHCTAIDGKQALIIIDECHHVGDQKKWGASMKDAFDEARFRLHLSGTPFRNDGNVIPFIEYKPNGFCDCDPPRGFKYTYSEAMDEDVCRPVGFRWLDAELSYRARGIDYTLGFTDDVNSEQERERLRFALNVKSGLVGEMIQRANDEINSLRSRGGRFADAAGLLIAMDQPHAFECATLIKDLTGEDAAVIVSDIPTATDDLERFKNDPKAKWVVAVKMITEGVDIPRLMVAVYATNVVSTLFFRQFVGRVCRVRQKQAQEMASIYMLRDERLMQLASDIEKEVAQFIQDNPGRHPEAERRSRESSIKKTTTAPIARVINGGVIIHGVEFTEQELADAEDWRPFFPEGEVYSRPQIAHALFRMREAGKGTAYTGGRRNPSNGK